MRRSYSFPIRGVDVNLARVRSFGLHLLLRAELVMTRCSTAARRGVRTQVRCLDHFEHFERTQTGNSIVLLSPRLEAQRWDELIVSWNAACPAGSSLKIEARAFAGPRPTRFYTIAHWSAEAGRNRTSAGKERDADAAVDTDTLICRRLMDAAQVRVTLIGTNGIQPILKLLALSFLNSAAPKLP